MDIDYDEFISPEQGVQFITDKILAAATTAIPTTSPPPRRRPVPWWTPEVAQAIAKRKRAFRNYLRHKDYFHLIARNFERAKTKRIIREAKRKSWQSFVAQLTVQTPLSKIWRLVRSLSGKRSISCIPAHRIQNTLITDPKTVVNTLAQNIARVSSLTNYDVNFLERARTSFRLPHNAFISNGNESYNVLFSLKELEYVIKAAGNTSVGPDGLHYNFFRFLPQNSLKFLLSIFNGLWATHSFPEAWREAYVVPLPKPGKNHQNPENYRPISLTSCLGKLFERMVARRLNWVLEQKQILSKFQSGFRKNRSTLDHLVRLETDIRKGFKYKNCTTAVFLDIRNAYDMVYKPALLFKLYKLGFKGHLAHYLKGFLSVNRLFQVRCKSEFSETHALQNGLPQGSCLSPILFNIMINDLFDNVPSDISHSLFADDSAIWCTDTEPKHSVIRLQRALNRIDEWSQKNGLIFSAKKSATVIFTKRNLSQPTQALHLAGNAIPFQSSFKFLGVILDRRLSMKKHIQYVRLKCSKRLNLFRCITGTEYGADRRTLLHMYKTLVLPIIEYGSVVYSGASDSSLKQLDVIQNSFIRIALGAMKTSPVSSLQVESMTTPLYLRRIEQTLRFVSKIEFLPNHTAFDAIHVLPGIHHDYIGPAEKRSGLTIASRVNKFCREINFVKPIISPLPNLSTPPWQLEARHIHMLFSDPKSSMSSEEIKQKFNRLRSKYSRVPFIYTDGSKSKERTAAAIVCGQHLDMVRLPDGTSIFSAELHAIFLALNYIHTQRHRQAVICSDSRSALQALLGTDFFSPLLTLVINKHQELRHAGVQIQFLWVPGHSKIDGNEKVDRVAKDALTMAVVTETPIEFTSIRSSIRVAVLADWQSKWTNTAPETQMKCIKPKIEDWSSSYRKNRQEEKILTRLRIGHTHLTHSFIFAKEPRPRCTQCTRVLTVEHILLWCPQFQQHRRPLVEYCQREHIDISLANVLGDSYPELLRLLFKFLRRNELMDKI